MPLSLDGFEVLQRIGAKRELFEALKADAADAAERLIRKKLAQQPLDLNMFRALVNAVGEDTIELALQTMQTGEVRDLLERVDPNHTRSEPRRPSTATRRLLKLAHERINPNERERRSALKKMLKPRHSIPFSTLSMAARRD